MQSPRTSRFELYKDRAGEWRWRFVMSNNKIIATSSEGYQRKSGCINSIAIIAAKAMNAPIVTVKQNILGGCDVPTPTKKTHR